MDAFEDKWRCDFCDAELTGELLASGVYRISLCQVAPEPSKKETGFTVCNVCEAMVASLLGKALFNRTVQEIVRSHKERQAAIDSNAAPSLTN